MATVATPGQASPAAPAPTPTDPVSKIQAILEAERAPEQQQQQMQQAEPQTEGEVQPVEETEPEVPAGPNQGVEGEDAPGERPVAEIPVDQLEAIQLEVTTKGEDGIDVVEKPTIKELRDGYMRQKDYSRKTAEVARQREEVGEKIRQGIDGDRKQYTENLQTLQNVLLETVAPELKDVDWNHLATNDAFEYVRLRNRADQITQVLSTIQAKQQEISAKQAAEHKEAMQKRAASARAQLEQDIPGWNDTIYQQLMKAGEKFGFKPEEVATWVDPRAIKLLHAATNAVVPSKPSADKRTVVVPKAVKPGASNDGARAQQQSEAMKRLQGSGRLEDAAAVIRSRLG